MSKGKTIIGFTEKFRRDKDCLAYSLMVITSLWLICFLLGLFPKRCFETFLSNSWQIPGKIHLPGRKFL